MDAEIGSYQEDDGRAPFVERDARVAVYAAPEGSPQ
jgi:hypothetical protein